MSQFTGLVTGRQQIEGDSSETNSVNCDDLYRFVYHSNSYIMVD